MMVEYILDPQQLEGQGDQKDAVGRVATLDDIESRAKIDPPSVKEFPEQRGCIFAEITEGAVSFRGKGWR